MRYILIESAHQHLCHGLLSFGQNWKRRVKFLMNTEQHVHAMLTIDPCALTAMLTRFC